MNKFFSSSGFLRDTGLLIVRCLIGYIMIELFNEEAMNGYRGWPTDLKFPLPSFMATLGKLTELVGGISLILGLFTRMLAIPVIITMWSSPL